MTVEEARRAVLASIPFESWIDTELISCTARERRRFEADVARRKAEAQAERERLESIADLPDADLQWLLDQGWRP